MNASCKLYDEQYARIKVRQRPFSVYADFLRPASIKGREAIYEGRREGRMLVHLTGIQRMLGVVSLRPAGPLAMYGHRYPITEIGLLNLVRRLLEVAEGTFSTASAKSAWSTEQGSTIAPARGSR